jgi:hypothetical protein
MPDNNAYTPQESAEIAAAILELTENGEHAAAQALGQLAQDPEQLRAAMTASSNGPAASSPPPPAA